MPEPPYGQGRVAADAGATAMTDVSDGLMADLGHIATASNVGIDLSTAALSADRDAVAGAAAAVGARRVGSGCSAAARTTRWSPTFPAAPPAGWRAIGRVLDGPARVLVDGDTWHGNPGWQSF